MFRVAGPNYPSQQYGVLVPEVNRSGQTLLLALRFSEWFKSMFGKEEMELTLVGLANSGKTTFVNVIAVRNYTMYCRLRTIPPCP